MRIDMDVTDIYVYDMVISEWFFLLILLFFHPHNAIYCFHLFNPVILLILIFHLLF